MDGGDGPEDELREATLEAVRSLPETLRSAVYLFYYEQMSVAETARTLGIQQNAVKTRLSRARAKLKKALERCAMRKNEHSEKTTNFIDELDAIHAPDALVARTLKAMREKKRPRRGGGRGAGAFEGIEGGAGKRAPKWRRWGRLSGRSSLSGGGDRPRLAPLSARGGGDGRAGRGLSARKTGR